MANNASPYIQSFLKAVLENSRPIQSSFSEIQQTNIQSTSSFLYDQTNIGLKNTQQLNVDWSKFENHTFFSSAEAKVNLAFDQIINGYPFDGTKAEIEAFFERMTGFDRWVFDQFPKYKGSLHFSGTQVGEDNDGTSGTWIAVKDFAGALYPDISKNRTGQSILNPKNGKSFTIEAQVYVPTIPNDTQMLFQKLSDGVQGFSLYLSQSISSDNVEARFAVVSGAAGISAGANLKKGRYNHICATLNRDTSIDYVDMYVNDLLVDRSKSNHKIGELNIDASDALIGSGSSFILDGDIVTPLQTFSGSIDEFRVFHSVRSINQQSLFAKKALYASDDLKLYYRFNEPQPALTSDPYDSINAIVLDSSGNSLHSHVNNFFALGSSSIETSVSTNPAVYPTPVTGKIVVSGTIDNVATTIVGGQMLYHVTSTYYYALGHQLRQDAAQDASNPMVYEKSETTTVLFPAYPETISLNSTLLSSASLYDVANPNLITKLIPEHYLSDGAYQDGTKDPADGQNSYAGSGMPGQGKLTSQQIIVSFLYIWARFFDEIKLYLDAFSTLRFVDYDKNDTIPDNFLYDLVKQYGFYLPPLFNGSTIDQYINAENVGLEIATSAHPLKYVQNELLRRVLVNMPDVIQSKGTQHSIKSFLRAIGIDPNSSMRIREFGGPTTRQLSSSREKRFETAAMVNFPTGALAVSPFLSASRIEIGYPEPAGTMVQKNVYKPHGISDNVNDGLLTSGSWTIEAIYKFTPADINVMTSTTQSLIRLCTTGSIGTQFVANLLAISSSIDPKVVLYTRPGAGTNSPLLRLELPMSDKGIFDSSRWNVSFGCIRNDSISSRVSSSYFLRVATQNDGEVTSYKSTSSFFEEDPHGDTNSFRELSTFSPSGSFISIGDKQFIDSGSVSSYRFLNNISTANDEARVTDFNGRVSNLRFWSKALNEDEFKEHVRNFKSLGVSDPLINYNYNVVSTGSWERVRLDTLQKQTIKTAMSATLMTPSLLYFIDYTCNNNHLTGTYFPAGVNSIVGEIFDSSYLSPYFDESSTSEKIRVRSYLDQELVNSTPWASTAPVHEIVRSEQPTDDTRLSIEFSLIDALNRDIVTLFSTFDALDNALGAPELVYSPDYPDLERLRDVYFNRISQKINFQDFFEFFRWFDRSIGTFIEQLIPKKTRFKGTNFVIESHMLERNKLEYLSSEIYLGQEDRSRIRDVLQIQQIVGTINKF